jgi:hypothetical protein
VRHTRRPQCLQRILGYRSRGVGEAWHDDGVSIPQCVQTPGGADGKDARVDLLGWGADAHPVRPAPVRQPRAAEDLDRGGKVEGQNPVQREDDNRVHAGTLHPRVLLAGR